MSAAISDWLSLKPSLCLFMKFENIKMYVIISFIQDWLL